MKIMAKINNGSQRAAESNVLASANGIGES